MGQKTKDVVCQFIDTNSVTCIVVDNLDDNIVSCTLDNSGNIFLSPKILYIYIYMKSFQGEMFCAFGGYMIKYSFNQLIISALISMKLLVLCNQISHYRVLIN